MRTLAIALGMLGLLILPATAAAQSCPMGQLYCSAGWCCPAMPDGGTNVCCNGNPQNQGCTTTGYCGTSSGDGGASTSDGGGSQADGGGPVCPTGDLYCGAGWCCPPGQGGRTDVCCNMNPMSNGCTSNGNCTTSAGGSSSGSGSSSGGGTATPPAGCGTNQVFNAVACGGGVFCPANSTCEPGGSCQCVSGYAAANCMGALCNGMCSAPNYFCAPATAFGGSSGAASGSSGGGTSSGGGGGKSGCDANGTAPGGSAPWLALLAGASAVALWRGRRSTR